MQLNEGGLPEPTDEVDLLSLCVPILRAKLIVAISTFSALLLGMVVALTMRPVFTAEAVIMPPQQQTSVSSMLAGQLGTLGGLGGASALGLKNPADMIIGIIDSRSIADNLIDSFHLQNVYRERYRAETRKELARETTVDSSKDGLIHITVKDHDPKRAADLANAYVDQLHQINARLAIGEAAQRRLFYDQQLQDENTQLADAEEALKQMQQETGVIQPAGQAQMTLTMIANVQAEIASKEVELGVTRTFATDRNVDVARLQQEIASLKGELATLENDRRQTGPGDVQLPSGRVAAASLEYLRKSRDVKYHEALYELLSKQREAAVLDEAKSAPLVQIVDRAVVPEHKSGPPRLLILLGCGLFGFISSVLYVFVRSALDGMRRDPVQAARLQELRDSLSIGSQKP